MTTATFKRRKILNYSVNRNLQVRMLIRIGAVVFSSLFLSTLIYYIFANRKVTDSYQMFHIRAENFLDFLLPVVIISFVASLLLGVVTALFVPRYIAGSLYRIEQDVLKVLVGDLGVKISLRKGDEGESLAGTLNSMIRKFDETISRTQADLDESNSISGSSDTTEQKLDKLREIHGRMKDRFAQYRHGA